MGFLFAGYLFENDSRVVPEKFEGEPCTHSSNPLISNHLELETSHSTIHFAGCRRERMVMDEATRVVSFYREGNRTHRVTWHGVWDQIPIAANNLVSVSALCVPNVSDSVTTQ